jgi:hypothetical protein
MRRHRRSAKVVDVGPNRQLAGWAGAQVAPAGGHGAQGAEIVHARQMWWLVCGIGAWLLTTVAFVVLAGGSMAGPALAGSLMGVFPGLAVGAVVSLLEMGPKVTCILDEKGRSLRWEDHRALLTPVAVRKPAGGAAFVDRVGWRWTWPLTKLWWQRFGDADREGVRLAVDEAGVYLGGRHPRHLPWHGVAEVVLFTYIVGTELGDSEFRCVAFRPKASDPRSANQHSPNPFDWGPARRDLAGDAHALIHRAVERHAPRVRVRDAGVTEYVKPTPRPLNRRHQPGAPASPPADQGHP